MATFSLVLQDSADNSYRSALACRFAQAAVAAGHSINAVFFYSAAVDHANALRELPSDETDVATTWLVFAQQHAVPLIVCHTVATRRGIIEGENWRAGFQASGLTEFMASTQTADRVVQF
ncbi:sulfurtransferase complex subunit TusD [Idiomarina tyrosinivorans]|uniref:Sulfurtransferase complex subunit TusD n=1 Tax=Idiomarina tyrosinivorans TaxID=1445662 RepID=A0A432ZTZ4_9GAMM|nr:sulfurtransferase complex subunit TusD [Idiomarina tyrosinivorans]RUO81256.1 sulfurtransferase complex subunit TusD [Idiomarina tyrosinivorans]